MDFALKANGIPLYMFLMILEKNGEKMINIFIPGIGEEGSIIFSPQIFMQNKKMENIIISGAIDLEIEQAIYISLTLLNKDIELPKYIHVHFPEYSYNKGGISASLGIYFSMLYYTKKRILKNKYMMTGELDIEGNIYEIGQIKEKVEVFNVSQCDFMFIPIENKKSYENSDRVFGVSNIYEIQKIIDKLENTI